MIKLKILRKLMLVTVMVLMTSALIIPVVAMDFHVRPELPENQRQNGSTFFDLLVTPGQVQDLVIVISNISDNDIVVLVEPITVSTGRNGQINYTSSGEMDETLMYSFEDLLSLQQSQYDVPAQSSIEVTMNLRAPGELFDGAILGSIRVLRDATREEREAAGVAISQFASVNAVRLVNREDAEDIPVIFELGNISTESIEQIQSIVVPVRNTQPRLVQGAKATAQIFQSGSEESIFEYKIDKVDFAPNSIFPLTISDQQGNGIETGDYNAIIEVEHEGQIWSFEQDFHINTQAVVATSESVPDRQADERQSEQSIPMWKWIAIMVVGLLLIVIIVMIIAVSRRRKAFPRL